MGLVVPPCTHTDSSHEGRLGVSWDAVRHNINDDDDDEASIYTLKNTMQSFAFVT